MLCSNTMSAVRVPSLPPVRRLACALLALCWTLLHVAAVLHVHPHPHPHVATVGHDHAGCSHGLHAVTPDDAGTSQHAAQPGVPVETVPSGDDADEDESACGLCQAMLRTLEALTRDLAALLYLDDSTAPAFASSQCAPEAPACLLPPGRAPPVSRA